MIKISRVIIKNKKIAMVVFLFRILIYKLDFKNMTYKKIA
jgi:hypothetical protein